MSAALALGILVAATPAAGSDRAFELVTPAGSSAQVRIDGSPGTPDGNVVCWNTENRLLGSDPNGIVTADDGFCSRRTSSGWASEWVTGPKPEGDTTAVRGARIYYVSDDGSRVVFQSDAGIAPDYPGAPPGGSVGANMNTFLREGGTTRWLSRSPRPLPEDAFWGRKPLAASHDLSHGVFVSSLRLLPADTNDLIDVYAWTPTGVDLVTRGPDGAAVGGSVALPDSPNAGLAETSIISRDGTRIFFHHTGELLAGAPPDAQSVFMREGEQLTLVSPREGPGPAADVHFVGASDDGSIVYLATSEQLTDEPKLPGDALYRYTVATEQLLLVASRPGGVVPLEVSADGSTVVFRHAVSLYVHRGGSAKRIGTLHPTDWLLPNRVASPRFDQQALRMTDDGHAVVFVSAGSIGGTPSGTAQVYRWQDGDAGGTVERVSEPAGGGAPTAAASIGSYATLLPGPRRSLITIAQRGHPNIGRVMTADGQAVFFETAQPLVATDTNDVTDVYQWQSGQVSLVSSGTGDAHALYYGNSKDGRTVFFLTYERLLPAVDRNSARDLYAARVAGGFPPPSPSTVGAPPQPVGPGLSGAAPSPPTTEPHQFEPPVNPSPTAPPAPETDGTDSAPATVEVESRNVRASRRRAVVTVEVSAPGVVELRLEQRGGRGDGRSLAAGRRAVREAGDARVRMRLTRAARRHLRRRGRVRASLAVTLSPEEGERVESTRRVILRARRAHARRARVRYRRAGRRAVVVLPQPGSVRLELRRGGRGKLVARGQRRVPHGGPARVRVRLTRYGKRVLRRSPGRVRLTRRVRFKPAGGDRTSTMRRRVTVSYGREQ